MTEKIWYFAYGSNLNVPQLLTRIGEWEASKRAILKDYKLTFDVFSSGWNGGVADIVSSLGEQVYGVIYSIDSNQLKRLDTYEGVPTFYKQITVKVEKEGGELIDAITYIVVNKGGFIAPTKKYLETIINGLKQHGYGEDAVQKVKAIANGK